MGRCENVWKLYFKFDIVKMIALSKYALLNIFQASHSYSLLLVWSSFVAVLIYSLSI